MAVLLLEHRPDRSHAELEMTGALGVGSALVGEPSVQLVEARHRGPESEQQVAHGADLVFDWALSVHPGTS
jgi:2-methylaconitate cis-trans-isomerase PrpF